MSEEIAHFDKPINETAVGNMPIFPRENIPDNMILDVYAKQVCETTCKLNCIMTESEAPSEPPNFHQKYCGLQSLESKLNGQNILQVLLRNKIKTVNNCFVHCYHITAPNHPSVEELADNFLENTTKAVETQKATEQLKQKFKQAGTEIDKAFANGF